MLESIALAHAKEAYFCVLDLEGFIRELGSTQRCLHILLFGLDLAHLNEHTFNDAVDLRLSVTDQFISPFELLAESQEVVACFRRHCVEKFDYNLLVNAIHVEVELGEFRGGVVNALSVDITLCLDVVIVGGVV